MKDIISKNGHPAALTSELYNNFVSYLDTSERTTETYRRALMVFARYLKEHEIEQPTRADIIAFRDHLKERYKPATVKIYIVAVRLFFQWLEQMGLYPNIAEHIKGAKIDSTFKKDYLTSSQVKSVLQNIDTATAQGRRDYALMLLMITGGLRDIEIHRANIEDLGTLGNETILHIQGKGREERTEYIKITPEVEKAIRNSIKDRRTAAGRDPLFISLSNNSKGQRISARSVSGIVKKRLVSAGYNSERLTAHSLRHTAVTLALLAGNPLEVVQEFARHRNISTTQMYAHHLKRANNMCEYSITSAILG